jgi:hypothetical protein
MKQAAVVVISFWTRKLLQNAQQSDWCALLPPPESLDSVLLLLHVPCAMITQSLLSVWFAQKQIALLPLIQLQIITNNFESIRIYSNDNQRMERGKNIWSTIDALVAVFLHQTEGFPLRILACVVLSTQREQEEKETTKEMEKAKTRKKKRNVDLKKNRSKIMRWEDWITTTESSHNSPMRV